MEEYQPVPAIKVYEIYQLAVDVVSINSRMENRRDASDRIRSTFFIHLFSSYGRVPEGSKYASGTTFKHNSKDMFFL